MQVKLVVVEGQARQREVVLELPAIIGRSRGAAVAIGDAKVSRHHCELFESAGLVMVRDNNSLNGTLVDGQQVKESVVRPGARLTVGPLTFVVLYEPSEEATHEVPLAAAPATAGVPGAEEPDFAAWAAGDEEDAKDPTAPAMPDLLPPSASTPAMKPFVPNDVAETLDASTMATTPSSEPSPPAGARENRVAGKKTKPAKKPAKGTEQRSEQPEASETDAPVLPAAPTPAPADAAPPEVDFGWLAGEGPTDLSTDQANPSDETVFDESAAADQREQAEALEDEPTPSSPDKSEKKKPEKKRSWWPFGKKKAAKAKSQGANEEEPSESAATPPSDAEPTPMEPAADIVSQDATPPPSEEEPASSEPPPEDAPDSPAAENEDGFDDFLKGLGKK